jgi:hypothetical protein
MKCLPCGKRLGSFLRRKKQFKKQNVVEASASTTFLP